MQILIERMDHGRVRIDSAETLAERFFGSDLSSTSPIGFDARAGRSPRSRYTLGDLAAMKTMRPRVSNELLTSVVGWGHISELEVLMESWDLLDLSEESWQNDVGPLLLLALERFSAFVGLGPAVVTKLLALKRPRLVPICDSFVLNAIGAKIPSEPDRRHQRAAALMLAIEHLRQQAGGNRDGLQELQAWLEAKGIHRSRARILDALLWACNPASPVSSTGSFEISWSA